MWSHDDAMLMLTELGIQGMRTAGAIIKAHCPYCEKSDGRSFHVRVDGDAPPYICHRCQVKGMLHELVQQAWGAGRGESVRASLFMVGERQIEWAEGASKKIAPSKLEYRPYSHKPAVIGDDGVARDWRPSWLVLQGSMQVPDLPEGELEKHKAGPTRYLRLRGISNATQVAYGIRENAWAQRVVFPIRDWDGKLKALSQRRTYEGPYCPKCSANIMRPDGKVKNKCECGMLTAKYLHSKGFSKEAMLYGEHLYAIGCVPCLMEGMTGVVNSYDKGLRPPFALPLAVMGGSAAESQISSVLKKFPTGPIVVIRDHDDPEKYKHLPNPPPPGMGPGDIMAIGIEQTIRMLEPDRTILHVVPRLGEDPGTLTVDDVERIKDAICMERWSILYL